MAALDCIMWMDAWVSVGGYTVHGVWEGESAWECVCVGECGSIYGCKCEGVCVRVWVCRCEWEYGSAAEITWSTLECTMYVGTHSASLVHVRIKPLVAVCMCSYSTHRHTPLSALKRVPTQFTTAADHTTLLGNNSVHHFTSLVPSSCRMHFEVGTQLVLHVTLVTMHLCLNNAV